MIGAFIAWSDAKHGCSGYVIDGNGCHIWVGGRTGAGYGAVDVGGRAGRTLLVHRVRYEREIGPIPEGMELDHFACNNRACCNPRHVRPVTARENQLRSNSCSARNATKTHCPQGHPLSGDNLIRYALSKGQRSCRTCAVARTKLWREKRRLAGLPAL